LYTVLILKLLLKSNLPNTARAKTKSEVGSEAKLQKIDSDISFVAFLILEGWKVQNLVSIFDPSHLWVYLVVKRGNLSKIKTHWERRRMASKNFRSLRWPTYSHPQFHNVTTAVKCSAIWYFSKSCL